MTRVRSRNPVIALPYSEKHKAVPKELLVDYETGGIYVVSADDSSIIFDITDKIFEQIQNMSGDNIEITIEGIGSVKLTEIIKQLKLDIANSVQVMPTGEDIHYVSKENILDTKSISVVNRNIEIKGFSQADTHMIPRKGKNGEIEWIYVPMVPDTGNGGGGSIIPPGNPDDGDITEVYVIEPVNDKLYLRPTRRQKSVNLDRNCIVILPRVLDEFSEVEWYVVTNSFAPMLKFSNNIIWSDVSNTQLKPNGHHVYKFKSWDAGENWIAELVQYNRAANDPVVDTKYLEENYYNKNHVNENYYDREQVDQKIKDINGMDPTNYYTKNDIDTNHYDRKQVDDLIEGIEQTPVDLSNYYDKTQVDEKVDAIPKFNAENYYDKTQMEENYDNKFEIENKINTVVDKIPDVSGLVPKTELTESYYDKQQVDKKIEDVNGGLDPTKYYSKEDMAQLYLDKENIEANYYNKEDVDTKHYNKEEVNNLVSWKKEGQTESKLPTNN